MAKKKSSKIKIPVDSQEISKLTGRADDGREYALPASIEIRNDINLDMWNGKHWEVWDEKKEDYGFPATDPTEQGDRFRMMDNILPHAVDRQVAYLVGTSPKFMVRSLDKRVENLLASRMNSRILTTAWQRLDIPNMELRWQTIAILLGQVYVHPFWNGSKGRPMGDGVFAGDVDLEILYPNEVFPEPGVTYLDEGKWVVLRRAFPSSVVNRFDITISDLDNVKIFDNSNVQDRTNYRYRMFGEVTEGSQEYVVLYDYYERPTKTYQNGRHIVWCEPENTDKAANIIYSDKLPIDFEWGFPIVEFHERKVEGNYCATTCMERAIPSQLNFNLLLSMSLEEIATMRARYILPTGGMPFPESSETANAPFTSSRTGMIDQYNPEAGGRPFILPGTKPTAAEFNLLERSESQIFKHFYVTDIRPFVSRGGNTASAIRYLIEQDLSVLRRVYGEPLRRKLSQLGALILALYRAKAKTRRYWPDYGDFYNQQILSFAKEDINVTDVSVVPSTVFATPELVVEDELRRDIELGLLNPRTPEGQRELRLRTQTTAPQVLSPREQQELRVEGENQTMLQLALGDKSVTKDDLNVHWADDGGIHAAGHRDFAISPQVMNLPEKQRKVFEDIVRVHLLEHFPDLHKSTAALIENKQLREAYQQFATYINDRASGARREAIQELVEQGKVAGTPSTVSMGAGVPVQPGQ